ncbi:ribonuclease P protein component [Paracoccus cavernae]
MPSLPPDANREVPPKAMAAAAFAIADDAPRTSREPQIETLRNRPDFLRAASARRQGTAGFLLQARRRAEAEAAPDLIRVGYTCSKKIGNAVVRNRAKRRLRALVREIMPALGRQGWDYVLVGRPNATVSRDFTALKQDLAEAIARVHAPKAPSGKPAAPKSDVPKPEAAAGPQQGTKP